MNCNVFNKQCAVSKVLQRENSVKLLNKLCKETYPVDLFDAGFRFPGNAPFKTTIFRGLLARQITNITFSSYKRPAAKGKAIDLCNDKYLHANEVIKCIKMNIYVTDRDLVHSRSRAEMNTFHFPALTRENGSPGGQGLIY